MRFDDASKVVSVGDKFIITLVWETIFWIPFIGLKNAPAFSVCSIIGVLVSSDIENISFSSKVCSILVDQGLGKLNSFFVIQVNGTSRFLTKVVELRFLDT